MADVKITVAREGGTKEAETFGSKIADSLSKSLGKLGIGGGGGVAGAAAGGAAAGAVIGTGIMKLVDALIDFPMVAAVMKLFKLILTLLFLPLIPILKPLLILLAKFASFMMPVMMKLSDWVAKAMTFVWEEIFKPVFEALKVAWEVIVAAGAWIWDNILKPSFMFLINIGSWIWNQILRPGFMFLWNIGVMIWELIKSFFKGTISVVEKVWEWFKGLFKGSISVATMVWNWFKSLFVGGGGGGKQLGGIIGSEGLYMLHRGERVVSATERGRTGGNVVLNVTIDRPVIREENDMKLLIREMEKRLGSEFRRRISYI